MVVLAHDPDDERQLPEQPAGPRLMVDELVLLLERRHAGIAAELLPVLLRVEVAPHRHAPQVVLLRPARRAGLEVPQLLRVQRQHPVDERQRHRAVFRPAQERDRIDRADRAAGGRDERQPVRTAAAPLRLRLLPAVEVDAHARGAVAVGHVDRHLLRGVGEIAGVGADQLHAPQALDPAFVDRLGHGRLFIEAGNPVGRDHQVQQPLLHLLLDDVLERLGHGAALRRVGEGHLALQARILQVRPLASAAP